jgi:glycosyltransferase involved in cell wall biosynthesis
MGAGAFVDVSKLDLNERRGAMVTVSVIIPARNEAKVIAKCLDALAQADYPDDAYEVILVDNGSVDDTLGIAAAYAGRLNLKILTNKRGYISAVRNQGAAVATGEMLAFLDADCAPSPDWLNRAASLCSRRRIVGAFYGIPAGSSWVARTWYGDESKEKDGPVPFIPSGDLIMHRETFLKVGGFDETIETNEDCDFCERASAAGFEVVAYPELAVTHYGTPQSLAGFYRKQRWHGKHVILVTVRHLGQFRNHRAVSFAIYTFVCMAAILFGTALALLNGGFDVLIAAVSALMLLPVALAARQSLRRKRLAEVLPLAVLFLVYGLARAHCVLDLHTLFRRSRPRLLLPADSE